jgi:hypothetical protein
MHACMRACIHKCMWFQLRDLFRTFCTLGLHTKVSNNVFFLVSYGLHMYIPFYKCTCHFIYLHAHVQVVWDFSILLGLIGVLRTGIDYLSEANHTNPYLVTGTLYVWSLYMHVMCTYDSLCMCMYVYVWSLYVYVCVCLFFMYVYAWSFICVYGCMHVCMYVCMYVDMYVWLLVRLLLDKFTVTVTVTVTLTLTISIWPWPWPRSWPCLWPWPWPRSWPCLWPWPWPSPWSCLWPWLWRCTYIHLQTHITMRRIRSADIAIFCYIHIRTFCCVHSINVFRIDIHAE